MAFLTMESWDNCLSADLPKRRWSVVGTGMFTVGAYGRDGTNGLRMFQDNVTTTKYMTVWPRFTQTGRDTWCVFGEWVKIDAASAGTFGWHHISRDGSSQLEFYITSGGAITVRRSSGTFNTGTLLGTTSSSLVPGTWMFVEVKATLRTSGGAVVIQFTTEGGVTTTVLNLSGVVTGTSVNGWDGFAYGIPRAAGTGNTDYTVDFDNLYVLDSSGAAPLNDFIGAGRVVSVVASAGNGTHADSTPSTGTDRGALVDEATPDIADYVTLSTRGQRDTYNFAALGVVGTPLAIKASHLLSATARNRRAVGTAIRVGGATYTAYPDVYVADSAISHLTATDPMYHHTILTTNPATGVPYTVSDIDAAEFGPAVTH